MKTLAAATLVAAAVLYGPRQVEHPPGRAMRCGGGPVALSGVDDALAWLARHQEGDGSWSAGGVTRHCAGVPCAGSGDPEFDVGVTSLSLLAFLRAGYVPDTRMVLPHPVEPGHTFKISEVITRGLKWLMSRQDADGCVGPRGSKFMYNHAIATQVLCEASIDPWDPAVKRAAQRAVDFLVAAQNPGSGWRYSIRPGDSDSSITGWAMMALDSAERSGLDVPESALLGGLAWLEGATDPDGRTSYRGSPRSTAFACCAEKVNEHESTTALAVLARTVGEKEPHHKAVDRLVLDLPQWKENEIDFHHWYVASVALLRIEGPMGAAWRIWNAPLFEALTRHQRTAKDGCADGSWPSEEDRWGFDGGPVYATAINALTLEVCYRYPNVSRGAK